MEANSRNFLRVISQSAFAIYHRAKFPGLRHSEFVLTASRHYWQQSLIDRAKYLRIALPEAPRTLRVRLRNIYYSRTSKLFSTSSISRSKVSMATSDPSVPPSLNAAPVPSQDPKPLTGVEASKRRAAYKAVEDHFDTSYRYIGIGSGSTVVYVVEAIAAKGRDVTSKMVFVPTYAHHFFELQRCTTLI